MIDHIQIVVSDFARSLRFYETLLEVIGYEKTRVQLDGQWDGDGSRVAFGKNGQAQFYLTDDGDDSHTGLRLCFTADSRQAVEEFFEASIEAGARKRKQPEDKPDRGDDWYSCEMIDPDANIVEVVHKGDAAPMTADEERDVLGEKIAAANALAEWEREKARRVAEAEAAKGSGRGMSSMEVGTMAGRAPTAAEEEAAAAAAAKKKKAEDGEDDDMFGTSDSSDDDDPFGSGGDEASADDDDPFASLGSDEAAADDDDPFASLGADSTASDDDDPFAGLGGDAASGDDDPFASLGGDKAADSDDDEIDWDALLNDTEEKK